jgi:hypothetical protein
MYNEDLVLVVHVHDLQLDLSCTFRHYTTFLPRLCVPTTTLTLNALKLTPRLPHSPACDGCDLCSDLIQSFLKCFPIFIFPLSIRVGYIRSGRQPSPYF